MTQGYGQSEILALARLSPDDHRRVLQLEPGVPLTKEIRDILSSAGKPSPGTELSFRDSNGHECAPGTIGMIFARNPIAQFAGYVGNPQKTSETMTNDGFLCTGDFGYLDDRGYVHVEGRGAETIVLTTGSNIYTNELEDTLSELDGIAEVGVAPVRVKLGDRYGSVDEVGIFLVKRQ